MVPPPKRKDATQLRLTGSHAISVEFMPLASNQTARLRFL